jgi:hypothetical protein
MAKRDMGKHGVAANKACVAGIQASGDDLHMFGDGGLMSLADQVNAETAGFTRVTSVNQFRETH